MDISKQVNLIDPKGLNRKNNEDYSKFLEISNRKTAIFRDIIIESECKQHTGTIFFLELLAVLTHRQLKIVLRPSSCET